MEGVLISTLSRCKGFWADSVSGNQSNQTLRLANCGLCLAGGKALSDIKRHIILPSITEVMVSLRGEDIHTSNRSGNVRFRYNPRQREDYHKKCVVDCQVSDSDHWS